MSARAFSTPYEAAHAFGDTLQHLISCLVNGKIVVGGIARPEAICSAVLNDLRPAELRGPRPLWLRMAHNYRATPVDGDPAKGWTVSTLSYFYTYTLTEQQKPEVIAFHWHPGEEDTFIPPHLHVGAAWLGRDAAFSPHWHIPTGRIPLAHVLHLAIREFGARPLEYAAIFNEALVEFSHEHSWAV